MQFKKGDFVIYGVHGRCEITGIESKMLNQASNEELFYELKPLVSTKNDSKFLIPVEHALENGMRQELDAEEVGPILEVLGSPEFFIELQTPWLDKEKKIETLIRYQGAIGLSKAVRHLFAYHQYISYPEPVATKTYKKLFKILAREVAQAVNIHIKKSELMLSKSLSEGQKSTQ